MTMFITPSPEVAFWTTTLVGSFVLNHHDRFELVIIVWSTDLPCITVVNTTVVKVKLLSRILVTPVFEGYTSFSMPVVVLISSTSMYILAGFSPNIKAIVFIITFRNFHTFTSTRYGTINFSTRRILITAVISQDFTIVLFRSNILFT